MLCLLLPFFAQAEDARTWTLGQDVNVTEFDSAAYLVVHEQPYPANALVTVMPDSSVVVVNTLYTPEAARELLAWIGQEIGAHPVVAINTHFHVDCLGGNAAFIEAGWPVYGPAESVTLLAERGEVMRSQMLEWLAEVDSAQWAIMRDLKFVPPSRTFPLDSGLTLTPGGERVELYFPGPAHAPDNIVVWFPARKILFGGCMILAGERIGNTADADLARWKSSVENLRRFPAEKIIPGHRRRFDPELLGHTLELLP